MKTVKVVVFVRCICRFDGDVVLENQMQKIDSGASLVNKKWRSVVPIRFFLSHQSLIFEHAIIYFLKCERQIFQFIKKNSPSLSIRASHSDPRFEFDAIF